MDIQLILTIKISLPLLTKTPLVITTPPRQQIYIKLFYRNQMHYNYKSDEKILETLIHRNILPTDPNKKIKLQ